MSLKLKSFNFMPYAWSHKDEFTNNGMQNIVRIYGWNEKNESVYVRVEDIQLPIFVQLDDTIEWDDGKINVLSHKIMALNHNVSLRPLAVHFEMKQRSYYAYVDKLRKPNGNIKYTPKLFPYLMVTFASMKAQDSFVNAIKKDIAITGMGKIKLKPHAFERSITPVLKLMALRQLPSAGWIQGKGLRMTKTDKETTRDIEYAVSFQDLTPMPAEQAMKMPMVFPKVMSFDNEANSSMTGMPKSSRPGDKIFQIGFTILDPPKNGEKKKYRKFLLSLGQPSPIEDVVVKHYKCEADLIVGLTEHIREEDPEVILGFNILGWDIQYMIERSKKICRCLGEFDMMGCIDGQHAPEEPISWTSSAFGKQEFIYLNAEGRLFIDLLPYIKRNYKLPNYRLETVCEEFLKTNKDPLKAKDIFRCYRQFTPESLALVGKYCVKDGYVTLLLYEKLQVWYDLAESATTNHVPMFDMFTKGQQIKMYAQVYEFCLHKNIVIESNAYVTRDDEHYTGAYVSEPIKGLYKKIVPFDFASLYPSIMMAHNIDYSKLVLDASIPDEDCHIFEWQDHYNCEHDMRKKKASTGKNGKKTLICAKYKYRFLKHEVSGKGIIPTLLEDLINARKKTRKILELAVGESKMLKKLLTGKALKDDHFDELMKCIKIAETENTQAVLLVKKYIDVVKSDWDGFDEKETGIINERLDVLDTLIIVLDKRQNSYKVSANSMYGAMGVSRGYLPFMPGAMCVTFVGRMSILKANKFIQENFGGQIIYNDTDSAYCHFPDFDDKAAAELWAHALRVCKEVEVLFPRPINF